MKKDEARAKSRKARTTESTTPFIRLTLCGVKAAAVALLAAFAIIFAGCAVGTSLADPAACAAPIGISAFFISYLLCGFVSSKIERGAPLTVGLFSAAIYLIPLLTVSFLLKGALGGTGNRTLLYLFAPPCSVIGAFFGNIRVAKRKTAAQMRRRR